jgi:Zn-dependent protease
MLGWSINLFRVFGIQLAVHASFVLLLAYAAIEGWSDGGGWLGMLASVLLTVLFFVCVVLHELGHSLTARRYGVQVPRILLMPIGGMAEFDRIPRQPRAELLITIAGPAVNFAIFGLLAVLVGLPHGMPFHPQIDDTLKGLGQVLLYWNVVMGTFNLLPVFPMDGGRIFRALLARRMPYLRATYVAAVVGKVLALLFAAVAALYLHQFLLAALFAFIFFAGDAEYRAVLRREQEAAYWAQMARRIESAQHAAPDEEPPFILHGPN